MRRLSIRRRGGARGRGLPRSLEKGPILRYCERIARARDHLDARLLTLDHLDARLSAREDRGYVASDDRREPPGRPRASMIHERAKRVERGAHRPGDALSTRAARA